MQFKGPCDRLHEVKYQLLCKHVHSTYQQAADYKLYIWTRLWEVILAWQDAQHESTGLCCCTPLLPGPARDGGLPRWVWLWSSTAALWALWRTTSTTRWNSFQVCTQNSCKFTVSVSKICFCDVHVVPVYGLRCNEITGFFSCWHASTTSVQSV